MKHRLLLACLVVSVAGAAALVDPASARPGSPVLSVTGVAGSSYWVDVSQGTQLANSTSYSTSPHAWSGIGLVKPSRNPNAAQVFVALDIPQSVRCAGTSCPWTVPPPDLSNDDEGRLAPGRYRLVLLGDHGARVSVTLQPLAGRVRMVRRAPAVRLSAALHQGVGVAGRQAVLHVFDSMPGGHGFAVMWSVQYEVLQPAGVLQSQTCITDGPDDTVVASAGGVAPCADFKGVDFFGPADAGPTSLDGTPGYAPVNAAAAGMYGLQDSSPAGVGWDASAVAPAAYLGDVFVGFAVPFDS